MGGDFAEVLCESVAKTERGAEGNVGVMGWHMTGPCWRVVGEGSWLAGCLCCGVGEVGGRRSPSREVRGRVGVPIVLVRLLGDKSRFFGRCLPSGVLSDPHASRHMSSALLAVVWSPRVVHMLLT